MEIDSPGDQEGRGKQKSQNRQQQQQQQQQKSTGNSSQQSRGLHGSQPHSGPAQVRAKWLTSCKLSLELVT